MYVWQNHLNGMSVLMIITLMPLRERNPFNGFLLNNSIGTFQHSTLTYNYVDIYNKSLSYIAAVASVEPNYRLK